MVERCPQRPGERRLEDTLGAVGVSCVKRHALPDRGAQPVHQAGRDLGVLTVPLDPSAESPRYGVTSIPRNYLYPLVWARSR